MAILLISFRSTIERPIIKPNNDPRKDTNITKKNIIIPPPKNYVIKISLVKTLFIIRLVNLLDKNIGQS